MVNHIRDFTRVNQNTASIIVTKMVSTFFNEVNTRISKSKCEKIRVCKKYSLVLFQKITKTPKY